MTIAVTTLYPWNIELQELPRPAGPGHFLELGFGTGARVLDTLRYNNVPVSAVLACPAHRVLHIPTTDDDAAAWRLTFHHGFRFDTSDSCSIAHRMGEPVSHTRIWLLPPDHVQQAERTELDFLVEAMRTVKIPTPRTQHRRIGPNRESAIASSADPAAA